MQTQAERRQDELGASVRSRSRTRACLKKRSFHPFPSFPAHLSDRCKPLQTAGSAHTHELPSQHELLAKAVFVHIIKTFFRPALKQNIICSPSGTNPYILLARRWDFLFGTVQLGNHKRSCWRANLMFTPVLRGVWGRQKFC